MQRNDVMRQARAAGLASHIDIGRILLWGGLAIALLSVMSRTPWLMQAGVLFAGIGAWILWQVLKLLPAASPPS